MTTGLFDYMQVDNQPDWFDVEEDSVKWYDRDMTATTTTATLAPRELVVLQAINRAGTF